MKTSRVLSVVALVLLVIGCQPVTTVTPTAEPVVANRVGSESVAFGETGKTLVCQLSDGTGILTATHAVAFAEGWLVTGIITVSLSAADVFTIAGPVLIAPEGCVVKAGG